MTTARDRAEQLFSKSADKGRSEHGRDTAFFALRKEQDAVNQEKTRRLRELRLTHEATLPKVVKPGKRRPKTG